MIRPILGLTLACFLVGCGATVDSTVSQTETEPETIEKEAATKTTADTRTVVFSVPGMT